MSANVVKSIFSRRIAVYNNRMYEQYPVVLATAAFIMDTTKTKILVIKKSSAEQIDAGLWTVPGGKVHPSEPIIDSLKREVKEEVGLEVTAYDWVGEDVFVGSNRYFHAQHFRCTVASYEHIVLEQKMQGHDWVSIQTIDKFAFPPNIKKRILQLLKK